MRTCGRWLAWMGCIVAGAAVAGCESANLAESFGLETPDDRRAADAKEARCRSDFQATGDAEAFSWLLAHRVAQGMTVSEVGAVLGVEGERVEDDGWLKEKNEQVWTQDVAYRWGPDSKGQTVYLFFREGRLVNYDPTRYQ